MKLKSECLEFIKERLDIAYKNKTTAKFTYQELNTIFNKNFKSASPFKFEIEYYYAVRAAYELRIGVKTHLWKKYNGKSQGISLIPLPDGYEHSNSVIQKWGEKVVVENKDTKEGIYLITDGEYFKIGVTTNINKRLSSLQTSNPKKLSVICMYNPSMRSKALEKLLHECYQEYRAMGEWFSFKITPQEFIEKCKLLDNVKRERG